MLLGLVTLSILTTCTLTWNAPTRACATEALASANASLVMKELLANELFALTTVIIVELAGLNTTWP